MGRWSCALPSHANATSLVMPLQPSDETRRSRVDGFVKDADVRGDGQRHLRRAPLLSVMEIADFGDRDDQPGGCSGDRSVIWGVFLEPEVRSTPMRVPEVGREDAPEMRRVDDDHVVETLASDRADQATYGCCHGLAGAETTSAMPMPASRRWKTSP